MLMKASPVMVVILFLSAILIAGCETSKGVAIGIGATAQGLVKDTKNFWHTASKTDDWIRKNLW